MHVYFVNRLDLDSSGREVGLSMLLFTVTSYGPDPKGEHEENSRRYMTLILHCPQCRSTGRRSAGERDRNRGCGGGGGPLS